MQKEVFIKNREKLMNSLEDNSLVILFAGNAKQKSADEYYQFTPNRNFYYFSGIDEEVHVLVMSKENGVVSSKLFLKVIDEEMERWYGKTLRADEAKEISGIEDVVYLDSFENFLNKKFNGFEEINLYLDLQRENYGDLMGIPNDFVRTIKEKYPQARVKNIFPKIIPLRLVKSEREIEEMQKAIDITVKGVNNIMKNAKPGMKEYEMEAYYEFVCRTNGVRDYAFKTIAAAGKNGAILHYSDNICEAKDGDLILFDLGAQYKYYNADISRTFPVNGKFSPRQKAVYESVLKVNKKVIEAIKPGVKYLELNKLATKWIAEECIKLGLIEKEEEVGKYYWHSIGHSLGLDTHDIDRPDRNVTFQEGMVWTVEPGIYIAEEGIGVRIEDDVVVTKDGCRVLTKDMIKEVEDIEKFMSEK